MSTTTDEGDKAVIWNADTGSSISWRSLEKFKPSCCRDKYLVIPIVISIIALFLVIGTIFGVAVRWSQMTQEIAELRAMYKSDSTTSAPVTAALHSSSPKTSLVSYIRWGKKTCPEDNTLIYAGFGAGSSSGGRSIPGGGVNHLCMPPTPEWNKFDMRNDSYAFSWLYAAEYLSFEGLGLFPDDVHGHNVACSVCLAPRSAKITIPAQRTCPITWTKEYEGYLMTSYVTEHKMEVLCVDEKPDVIAGTQNITGGDQLFFMSAYCRLFGGLSHCPPYINARELTCVVCTK